MSTSIGSVQLSGQISGTSRAQDSRNTSSTSAGAFERGTLSIQSTSEDSANTRQVSPERIAAEETNRSLFQTASALNQKQAAVDAQLEAVYDLIDIANQIQSEPASSPRSDALTSDAEALLEEANSDYQNSVAENPGIAQTQDVTVTVDPNAPVGSSERTLVTSLTAAPSLSQVGVSSDLSFASSDIASTITTLESAASSLRTASASYDSTRSNLQQAVNTQSTNAKQRAEATGEESPEDTAKRLADQITKSKDSLLASANVDQLDIASLLDSGPAIESRTNIDDNAGVTREDANTQVDSLLD